MNIIANKATFFGLAIATTLAGQAHAQVAFSAEHSRSELPVGNPSLVTWTWELDGVYNDDFSGTQDPIVDVVIAEEWDVATTSGGPFSLTDWFELDEAPEDPSNYVFEFPALFTDLGYFPVPAQAAFSSGEEFSFASSDEFGLHLLQNGLDDAFADVLSGYQDECYQWNEGTLTAVNPTFGTLGTVVQGPDTFLGSETRTMAGACDALDLSVNLDGVEIGLSFEEDSILPLITIPSIGLTYQELGQTTSSSETTFFNSLTGSSVPATEIFEGESRTREEALRAFENYLVDTGKDKELASALTGISLADLPDIGALPQGGDLLALEAEFTRTQPTSGLSLSNVTSDGNGNFSLSFGIDSIGEILGYYLLNVGATEADFGLDGINDIRDTDGGLVTLTVIGVSATLSKPENSTTLTLTSTDLEVSETFTGPTLDDSFSALEAWFNENEDDLGASFLREAQEEDIASDPTNIVAGNPQSVQGVFNANLLALDSPSSLLLETSASAAPVQEPSDAQDGAESEDGATNSRRTSAGGAWLVGGRIGQVEAGEDDAIFLDVIAERGFRVGEGSRDRIKVSLPFSFLDYGDVTQSTGSLRIGYERQIIDGVWVLEPSVGAGYAFASGDVAAGSFEAGSLWSAGLASRYKIGGIGKGHIVIGNAVGYSQTFDIEVEGAFKSPEISNISYRNGLAYQMPIGQRVFDRLGTMRVSYTHTKVAGSQTAVDEYHDVSFNYGVGSRESTIRNISELLRIGFSGTFGEDYTSYALTAGFKF